MNVKCLFGLHKWNGCICGQCNRTRDESHDWSKDCEKCAKCGKTRQNAHNWDFCECTICAHNRSEPHDWSKDCEKCAKCGKTRDEEHDWSKDCQKCAKCGKTRDKDHAWKRNCEKCDKCGRTRFGFHDWIGGRCSKCGITITKRVEEAIEVFHQDFTSGKRSSPFWKVVKPLQDAGDSDGLSALLTQILSQDCERYLILDHVETVLCALGNLDDDRCMDLITEEGGWSRSIPRITGKRPTSIAIDQFLRTLSSGETISEIDNSIKTITDILLIRPDDVSTAHLNIISGLSDTSYFKTEQSEDAYGCIKYEKAKNATIRSNSHIRKFAAGLLELRVAGVILTREAVGALYQRSWR